MNNISVYSTSSGKSKDIFAPILVTVYNRVEHFKNCIKSLRDNFGAEKTPLYIAVDYPYRDSDKVHHDEIIKYCNSIDGFLYVYLILRDKNVGAVVNSTLARAHIFTKYDRLIRTEDDNVFSPYFIEYINTGFDLYEENPFVFAVCGYCPPISSNHVHEDDVFLSKDCTPYGFGVWRSKYEQLDLKASSFIKDFFNPLNIINFKKTMGDHFFAALTYAAYKKISFNDASTGYHLYKNNMVAVLPVKTLVRNIGQDGSGINSKVNNDLQYQEIWQVNRKIRFPNMISYPNDNDKNRSRLFELSFFNNFRIIVLYYFVFLKAMFGK